MNTFMSRLITELHVYQMMSPRLVQAVVAAVGDVYTHRLANRWFGEQVATWTV